MDASLYHTQSRDYHALEIQRHIQRTRRVCIHRVFPVASHFPALVCKTGMEQVVATSLPLRWLNPVPGLVLHETCLDVVVDFLQVVIQAVEEVENGF